MSEDKCQRTKNTFSPKKISMVRILFSFGAQNIFSYCSETCQANQIKKKHSLGKNNFNAAIWFQLKDFSIVPIVRICIVDGSH